MTKLKTSVTVDPAKVEAVRRITGAGSTSAAIDAAMSEMIALHRIRHDVLAYRRIPLDVDEVALAHVTPDWSDLADDTDWAALYDESE